MLYLVVAIIALGWICFAVLWGRDRLASRRPRIAPNSYGLERSGPFAVPRTEEMARVRRHQVLVGLIFAAILTLILTRLWSAIWTLHIVVDIALLVFAIAMYRRAAIRRPREIDLAEPEFSQYGRREIEVHEIDPNEIELAHADALVFEDDRLPVG